MTYQFLFEGGINNSYYFETKNGVIYEIKFKPTPYLLNLESKEISDNVFEFVILVKFNSTQKLPSTDKSIGKTTVAIFKDFYLKNGNTISIYICDSSDSKEFIRKRKFDNWFTEFNDETFLKVDEVICDKNNNKYPISLILSKKNPFRSKIIESFIEISMDNSK